jgi:hypothetical protein
MVDIAVQFGGCLTINWHDRSIAPERMWGASYRDLIQDLKGRGAWFATAGQAISWFRKRRSVVFESDCSEPDAVRARVTAGRGDNLPGLRLRIHKAQESCRIGARGSEGYADMLFDESVEIRVPGGVGGSYAIPVTHAENCAEAIILAGLVKGPDGDVFNAVDNDVFSSRERYLQLAEPGQPQAD